MRHSRKKPLTDPIVEAVVAQMRHRSTVGIKKYGVTMERGDLSFVDWLRHLQQELMDGAIYCEKLITIAEGLLGNERSKGKASSQNNRTSRMRHSQKPKTRPNTGRYGKRQGGGQILPD